MHCQRTDHWKAANLVAARLAAAACFAVSFAEVAAAAELREAEQLFRTGKYADCARLAAKEIENGSWNVDWPVLKANAELAEGKYPAALHTVEEALDEHQTSLRLRLLARTVSRLNGKNAQAAVPDEEIGRLLADGRQRFESPSERVALGRFLLERGADPRQILELLYDPLRKDSPDFAEAYFATAELALDKYDNALAAETLQSAPKKLAEDPQYHYLLARAFATDEPARAVAAIEAALAINPNHIDSLLLEIDQLIDAEGYDEADTQLQRVLTINANHPTAWAYKAVLAHLASDAKAEEAAHKQALSTWPKNPEVDNLIGNKLSQKYRFAEGAAYQRKSLACDANYRPAKLQLSQDLLRLGAEAEGWRLADEVAKQDAYDVVAFNLVTLQDELTKFRTIGGDGLQVRMEAREADLYGDRAVELLQRARKTICEKYDVKLDSPIVIEIFPKQKDFAVRTFGMPGASGFLGVCFGRVITANSPASQGERPANWQSVLWHEFCHVVTLHKTRNKMPRWLSEGISVYEERQADPAWGQSMNPQYRELILNGKLTPVSQLSSAFLAPKSPLHLQFAYYESSLVVEYLIQRFGLDGLCALLKDLGDGMDINQALIVHTEPLNRLDADLAKFARDRADALAPTATWDEPDLPPDTNSDAIAAWVKEHPRSIPGLKQLARQLLLERKYQPALEAAKHLREIFPADIGPENAYGLMVAAHRGLNDVDAERASLEELASRDTDASDAHLRLMEIGEAKKDWDAVATNARRMLAVNPLVAAPHRYLARAAENLGRRDEAIRACQALLKFDTTDIAETHFRLASLLRDDGKPDAARRQTLMALEEAPRYLAAHKLLLELRPGEPASAGGKAGAAAEKTTAQ